MNGMKEYIIALVSTYISGMSSVVEFQSAFAGAYFHVRQYSRGDVGANQIASKLVGPVAEFVGGHRTEESLRRELAAAVRPFEERDLVFHNGNYEGTSVSIAQVNCPTFVPRFSVAAQAMKMAATGVVELHA